MFCRLKQWKSCVDCALNKWQVCRLRLTMARKKTAPLCGEAAFDEYYRAIYKERWPALKAALLLPMSSAENAYTRKLVRPYFLNAASVWAACSLRLPEKGEILDACAAPGGKSLVIASRMGDGTRLLANELSSERRRRLNDTLNTHLPPAARERVTISGFDAAALAARPDERGRFAAILLDAPCSSERHVLQSPARLAQWTPARPTALAARQWALLSGAFLLLADGGSLVYATCALSQVENDSVAARLAKKYGKQAVLDRPDFEAGVETDFGRLVLPDADNGAGPMYVSRWRKGDD
jgi:16S rRNA (cytosine1407-C5)-methyltransferase